MAYNTLKGKVNFSNSTTGSIESMVDDYSNQTVGGVKNFTSTLSASAFYDTTTGALVDPTALSSITNDGAERVIVSDGDGTATGYATLTYDGTTLTASVSGSAAAMHSIPLEPHKVSGQLSASNIYFGAGLQDSSNKIAAQGGNSITVDGTGINVDLATTGGLAHDNSKLKVSPNAAAAKGTVSDNDMFLIGDSDASNATKKTTMSTLGTYMQNTLTFATPGGSDNQVQYKNGSSFAGNANLSFDGSALSTLNISASGEVSASLFIGNGSGLVGVTGVNASGIDTSIQFNSSSAFTGSSNLLFDFEASPNALKVTGDLSASTDLLIGRDVTLARDIVVGRHITATGQISSSNNISGTAFYGEGHTLSTAPINNYTSNRLVVCGATSNTLDTHAGLTWNNPLLSVPGNISASSTLHANGAVTFGSTLKTTGSIVSFGGMRVSGSAYSYTLRDDSKNDLFKAELNSGHGRVRVRDAGNAVRVQLDGNGGVVSGSGTATFGALTVDGAVAGGDATFTGEVSGSGEANFGGVDIFEGGNKVAYMSGSGEISGSSVHSSALNVTGIAKITGSLEITGSSNTLLTIHAKDSDVIREIVFAKDGTTQSSIQLNSNEHLIFENESTKDIILKTNNQNTIRLYGANQRVAINKAGVTPAANLDVTGDAIVSASSGVAITSYHNPTDLSNDTGGGEVVMFGGGSLTAGKLYYLHTDGNWTEVDADAVASGADQMLGIALGSDPADDGVLIRGYFDAHTYLSNFSAGKAVYVSTTAASMDTTAPAGSGDFVRIVGYCTTTANVIYFNPSSEWIELD